MQHKVTGVDKIKYVSPPRHNNTRWRTHAIVFFILAIILDIFDVAMTKSCQTQVEQHFTRLRQTE